MTTSEFKEIEAAINTNEILKLPRFKLEQFSASINSPNANLECGENELIGFRKTIETALHIRISEDQSEQAKKQSNIAMIIAASALVLSFAQLLLSGYQVATKNEPTPVYVVPTPQKDPISATKKPDRVSTLPNANSVPPPDNLRKSANKPVIVPYEKKNHPPISPPKNDN